MFQQDAYSHKLKYEIKWLRAYRKQLKIFHSLSFGKEEEWEYMPNYMIPLNAFPVSLYAKRLGYNIFEVSNK